MEGAKITIIGLVVLLILSNGAQYILNETGSNKACSSGWVFQASGDHEGQYACLTSNPVRYEYCARVWDTATGKQDYWCAQATLQQMPSSESVESNGVVKYLCHAPASRGCERIQ